MIDSLKNIWQKNLAELAKKIFAEKSIYKKNIFETHLPKSLSQLCGGNLHDDLRSSLHSALFIHFTKLAKILVAILCVYIFGVCIFVNTLSAKSSRSSLRLFIVGDALIHKSVYEDALGQKEQNYANVAQSLHYDFTKMLELIAPISKKHDLAFYNQESILGGTHLGLSTYPRFNSPQEFGLNMLKIGFNLVSLANNHTLDRGEAGVRSMLDFWRKMEARNSTLYTTGSFESFKSRQKIQHKILHRNDISYAMLAYTYGTNGIPLPQGKEYLVNIYTKEMLKGDIEAIRAEVDLLIVSIHWGVEYTHTPTKEQREIAKFLASLGVDIVIGNHPHAIQPIERIGNTLVFYALGNFISAQVGLQKRVGLIASVQIDKIQNARKNASTINHTTKPHPKRAQGKSKINNRIYKKIPKKIKLRNIRADLVYTYYKHEQKMSDFKVYPFSLLNDELLPNYQSIYKDYIKIISKDWLTIGL